MRVCCAAPRRRALQCLRRCWQRVLSRSRRITLTTASLQSCCGRRLCVQWPGRWCVGLLGPSVEAAVDCVEETAVVVPFHHQEVNFVGILLRSLSMKPQAYNIWSDPPSYNNPHAASIESSLIRCLSSRSLHGDLDAGNPHRLDIPRRRNVLKRIPRNKNKIRSQALLDHTSIG